MFWYAYLSLGYASILAPKSGFVLAPLLLFCSKIRICFGTFVVVLLRNQDLFWHLCYDESSEADVDGHSCVRSVAVVESYQGAACQLGDLKVIMELCLLWKFIKKILKFK